MISQLRLLGSTLRFAGPQRPHPIFDNLCDSPAAAPLAPFFGATRDLGSFKYFHLYTNRSLLGALSRNVTADTLSCEIQVALGLVVVYTRRAKLQTQVRNLKPLVFSKRQRREEEPKNTEKRK
jgi:hypothetical protein